RTTESRNQLLQRRRKAAIGREDFICGRQFRGPVTRGLMPCRIGDRLRHFLAAELDRKWATRMEAAPCGRIERTWHLALEDHAGGPGVRAGDWNGGPGRAP